MSLDQYLIKFQSNNILLVAYGEREVHWFRIKQNIDVGQYVRKRSHANHNNLKSLGLISALWLISHVLIFTTGYFSTLNSGDSRWDINVIFLAVFIGFLVAQKYRLDNYPLIDPDNILYKPEVTHLISIKDGIDTIIDDEERLTIPDQWVLGYRIRQNDKDLKSKGYSLYIYLTDHSEIELTKKFDTRRTDRSIYFKAADKALKAFSRDAKFSVSVKGKKIFGLRNDQGLEEDKVFPKELRDIPKISLLRTKYPQIQQMLNLKVVCSNCNKSRLPKNMFGQKPNSLVSGTILCRSCVKKRISVKTDSLISTISEFNNYGTQIAVWLLIVFFYIFFLMILTMVMAFAVDLAILFAFGLFGFLLPDLGKYKPSLFRLLQLDIKPTSDEIVILNEIYRTKIEAPPRIGDLQNFFYVIMGTSAVIDLIYLWIVRTWITQIRLFRFPTSGMLSGILLVYLIPIGILVSVLLVKFQLFDVDGQNSFLSYSHYFLPEEEAYLHQD